MKTMVTRWRVKISVESLVDSDMMRILLLRMNLGKYPSRFAMKRKISVV